MNTALAAMGGAEPGGQRPGPGEGAIRPKRGDGFYGAILGGRAPERVLLAHFMDFPAGGGAEEGKLGRIMQD